MSNRFAKSHATDLNQPEIIKALEAIGCTCHEIERPVDLLVEFRSLWIALEVKNRKGKNKLTSEQEIFFEKSTAPAFIVYDPAGAVEAVMNSWSKILSTIVSE